MIAGRISGPILALARGADEIRGGNLDVKIPVASHDEIGVLADSFNRMAARLRETVANQPRTNFTVEQRGFDARRVRQRQHDEAIRVHRRLATTRRSWSATATPPSPVARSR